MKFRSCFLFLIIAAILLSINDVHAQNIPKLKYQPNKILEDELGNTHAIKAGNTLYISGTVATGEMDEQVKNIMDDIKVTLSKYGASFENVVRQTVYTTDLDSFMAYKIILKSYYSGDYPASTFVEVKRLLLPQFKVEVEVTAELPPEGKR